VSRPGPIRVVIADSHRPFREGLKFLLSTALDLEIAGEGRTGREAVEIVAAAHPDVLLIELGMPDMNGAEVTAHVKADHPAVEVVVLASHPDPILVRQILEAGAITCLPKDSPTEAMVTAIRNAAAGRGTFDSSAVRALISGDNGYGDDLTNRELEVLSLMALGMSNSDIAGQLTLSVGTVRHHVSSILAKLDVPNRTTAVVEALQHGLI
jgi:DNA-binding NarL/FixJ family response regulator